MSARILSESIKFQDRKVIAKELTFKEKQTFFNKNKIESISMFKREGDYIHLPFRYFKDNFKMIPNSDRKHPDRDLEFTKSLLERQESVIEESTQLIRKNKSVILNLRPGFGKTACAIYLLAKEVKKLTLIPYDRVPIGEQWKRSIETFSSAKVWTVGEKNPPEDFDVILCSSRKFKNIPSSVVEMIGCLIVDECHRFCTKSNRELFLSVTPSYVIGLSATLDRNNGMEEIIYSVCGKEKVIRRNEVKHTIFKVNTGFQPVPDPENIWSSIVKQQSESPERNQVAFDLVKNLASDKICVLTSEVKHSELIYEGLKELGENVAIMAGKTKTYSDSRVLVGTVSKIGTGFDEESCCPDFGGERIKVLILLSSNKSHGIIEQVLGRSFRADDPRIYSLVDDHRICKTHWKELVKWSKANCGIIKEYHLLV